MIDTKTQADIHNTMRKLFSECVQHTRIIAEVYTSDPQTTEEKSDAVKAILESGIGLAQAFAGMVSLTEMAKMLGLTAQDCFTAAAATEEGAN